jgi:tRNA uridine 5-carboxymethylaminomethyl modification enzyme
MTSRSEYRLLLRQDNADERLMPIGREIGLIDDETYEKFLDRKAQKEAEIARLRATTIAPGEKINAILEKLGTTPLSTGIKMAELIKRPEVSYFDLAEVDEARQELPYEVCLKVETEIKYEGYIARQQAQVDDMLKLEGKKLPADTDYGAIEGLRLEAREKLNLVRPENIAQASRISGVSPSDVAVLSIWLQKRRMEEK